jgi:hypothetical protein
MELCTGNHCRRNPKANTEYLRGRLYLGTLNDAIQELIICMEEHRKKHQDNRKRLRVRQKLFNCNYSWKNHETWG